PSSSDIDIEDGEYFDGGDELREGASPERLLLTEELQGVVVATLEKLPEDLRTAITLRELDGLSYEDIANVMECPVGTVRSRIFRAREALDKQIDPLMQR
ncbi:MAG: sigma-70 family RNA polymerase sigma factor, partial [Psychrobium sp.]